MAIARHKIIQSILDLFEAPRYLEVGVNKGLTFHALSASHKVAVDPKFLFDAKNTPDAVYHEVESDAYFGRQDATERFDVIYLDGLHTAEQTLRDFINSLRFIKEDGIIIIDDVVPTDYASSLPNRDHSATLKRHLHANDRAWMGDVYKLVYFIDTFVQQYSCAVTSDNHGQAIVWPARREHVRQRKIEEIGSKTFEDVVVADPIYRMPFEQILSAIRMARGAI